MNRGDWLIGQLPMGMLEDEFFVGFVRIFQDVASTYLDDLDSLDHFLDASVTPAPFLSYLGSWLGVRSIDPSFPERWRRQIVQESSEMLAWRGTRQGIEQFLELVCDGPIEVIETGGIFREGESPTAPARIEIRVESTRLNISDDEDEDEGEGDEDEELGRVERLGSEHDDFVTLVLDELPANVPTQIFVGGQLVWPRLPQAVAS